MQPVYWFAYLGIISKVRRALSAIMVQSTRDLCDDITTRALIVRLVDFGASRKPGAALISDPEMSFDLQEADLPEDTMEQLRIDCELDFNQVSAKRAVGNTTVRLVHLLTSHT